MTIKMRPGKFQARPFEEIAAELSPRLIQARKKAHLTQAEAAKRAGISTGHLRALEKQGGRERLAHPRLETFYGLCAAYQISIHELLPPR